MGKKSARKKALQKEEEIQPKDSVQNANSNKGKFVSFTGQHFQALFLFVLSFALFANTISHEYAVDDAIVITKNTLTQQGLKGIPKIMKSDAFYGFFGEGYKLVAGGRYRPLSIVTFAIEQEFFGGNPYVSHFINVLLFSLSVLLLFYLLSALLKTRANKFQELNIPFLATLLFAAHPIHTEVVANIKGRDEIMGLLGALGALFLVWEYVETKKIFLLLTAVFVYVLALLSKENAITFLAVVPLCLYFFSNAKIKDYFLTVIPLLLVAGVYVVMRQKFTGVELSEESNEILNNPFVYASLSERLATVAYTFGEYFKLLIFPHPLTHDYYFNQVPIQNWTSLKAIIPFLFTLGLVVFAIVKGLQKNIYAFGILYFFITISVVSNVFFSVGIAMNERFIFLSSIGFCIILAAALLQMNKRFFANKQLAKSTSNSMPFTLIILLILGAYSFKTVTRNADWKNDFVLFEADYKNSPNSAKIKNAYGGELTTQAGKIKGTPKEKEYLQKAEKALTEALEIYPNYKNALLILGNVKWQLHKDSKSAISLYKRTLELHPNYYEGNFNMACVLLDEDKMREAIPYFKSAISSKSNKMEAWYNLGEAYFKLGMGDSAVYYFKQAARLAPNNSIVYYKIGLTYGKVLQELDSSIEWLKKAIEIKPDNVSYYEDLGVAYGFKKEYQKAVEAFENGLRITPNNKQLLRNIGVTYQQMGQEQKALEYFQRAGLQ